MSAERRAIRAATLHIPARVQAHNEQMSREGGGRAWRRWCEAKRQAKRRLAEREREYREKGSLC